MSKPGWKVTKNCPMCGKDNCKESADGAVVMCLRVAEGAFKHSKDGAWHFHRLIDTPKPAEYVGAAHRKPKAAAVKAKAHRDVQAAIAAAAASAGGTLAGEWSYHYPDGREALRVLRIALADGDKAYRPIHPAKDGWRLGDPSGLLPLYRLPLLVDEPTVFIVEGEKCADAVAGLGLAATTSAHGAGGAEKTDWNPLAGRSAIILPDADEPGRKYGQAVAGLLVKLEPPAVVRIVELPGLPAGGDVVEYLAAGGTRENIEALATQAEIVNPADLIGGPVLTCLADVQAKEINWLWPGRIPAGCITMLIGRPKEGKSFASIDIAARVSTGSPWPDGCGDAPGGSVILVTAEDDPSRVIRPRLDAHRGDCRRIHLLSAVRRIGGDGKQQELLFSLADVAALETVLKAHRDCKLIVVDPIGSFIGGGTDAHRDNEVRGVLAPVAKLAERYGPAVLIVAHRRKGSGTMADDLAMGSRAFTGLARANWHLSRDPHNKARRLLLPGGGNYFDDGVDGLAFTIVGERNKAAVVWDREPVAMSADDALAAENGEGEGRGRNPDERDDATDWLRNELADLAEHRVDQLRRDATEAGLAWRTVQRAASALRVIRQRSGFGGAFIWRLPRPASDAGHTCHIPKNENSGTNGTNGENAEKSGGLDVPQSHTCHNPNSGTNEATRGDDGVWRVASDDGRERGEL